jgi:hypothetical protein
MTVAAVMLFDTLARRKRVVGSTGRSSATSAKP